MFEFSESLLNALIVVWTIVGIQAIFYLITRLMGSDSSTQKVEHTGMTKDNIYTELAAKEGTKAAEQKRKAAEAALEAAKVNERTEQARLERAKLEHADLR